MLEEGIGREKKKEENKNKIIQFHIIAHRTRKGKKIIENVNFVLLMELNLSLPHARSLCILLFRVYMRSVDLNFSSTASGEASEWSVA